MPKFTDNEFPFTPEELRYLEDEMKKYKVPWLYKIVFGSLYKAGAVFFPLAVVLIAILGFLIKFEIAKWIAICFILGLGVPVVISWIWHKLKVLKECKRLRLTLYQWNTLAVAFQIKYI